MKNSWSTAPALVAILAAGGLNTAVAAPGPGLALGAELSASLARLRAQVQGADAGFDFEVRTVLRDRQGVSHAHLQQTYRGIPLWGAGVTLNLPDAGGGGMASPGTLVQQPLEMDVTPIVPSARAVELTLRHLAPSAPLLRDPDARLVLFPSVQSPRIKFITRRENGKLVRTVDTAHSAFGRSADPGPWSLAYHVHTEVADRKDGPRFTDYIVDARNGGILEVWDSLRRHRASEGHLRPASTPELPAFVYAKGVGHSQYSGDVSLDVTDDTANSGTFLLQDTLRSFSSDFFELGTANPSTGDYGLTVYNLWGSGFTWPAGQRIKFTNSAAAWGDGQIWNGDYSDYSGVNSETVAVDALHGTETYWDMLNNVFGQRGLGFANQGLALRVHLQSWFTFWNSSTWGVDIGDSPDTIWGPQGESLTQSMAQPEIIAHELTHGLVASGPALDGRGETGAVEESFADVYSALMKFYVGGAGAQGSVIPDQDGSASGQDAWTFGLQVMGFDPFYPVRSMARPQADGISPAAWYYGMAALDPHAGSGVGNRAFYFLSQGAGPYTGPGDQVPSSAYLPAGFQGIGNQKAALLWHDTLSQQLPSTADYQTLRVAVTFAAYNRFGPGSVEFAAVENAFAAVNIGAAAGQAPRPLVSLQSNSFINANLNSSAALFLVGVPTRPYTVRVANTTDTAVTWTAPEGGQISQDGTYLPPNLAGFVLPTLATSHADPLEYAVGYGLVVNADVDDDTEFDAVDAVDLGGQLTRPRNNHSADLWPDGTFNDLDVKVFLESFSQAFPK